MSDVEIKRSYDIEDIVRQALSDKFRAYVRPLPEKFDVPCLLVQTVGGTAEDTIDTVDIVIDSRAKTDAVASETLRNALGYLDVIAKEQTTPIRHISVNSSGSWGSDPIRPDLAMYSARIRFTAHKEKITI